MACLDLNQKKVGEREREREAAGIGKLLGQCMIVRERAREREREGERERERERETVLSCDKYEKLPFSGFSSHPAFVVA